MKKNAICCLLFLLPLALSAQKSIDKALKKWNENSIPYIYANELLDQEEAVLLDTREWDEYQVSHLKNAIWVGYDTFQIDSVMQKIPNKDKSIVVYCSIGVRSEDIGEKLQAAGYSDVKNLYGGIFVWKNDGYTVYTNDNDVTEKIHAFDAQWGKLLKSGEKVYSDSNTVRN